MSKVQAIEWQQLVAPPHLVQVMIRSMKRLAAIAELQEGKALRVDLGNIDLLVGVSNGQYYAVENLCPHAWIPIGAGPIRNLEITCPWHGLTFNLHNGRCTTWPDMDRLKCFDVIASGQFLYLVSE